LADSPHDHWPLVQACPRVEAVLGDHVDLPDADDMSYRAYSVLGFQFLLAANAKGKDCGYSAIQKHTRFYH
jgi:hypothetical protein